MSIATGVVGVEETGLKGHGRIDPETGRVYLPKVSKKTENGTNHYWEFAPSGKVTAHRVYQGEGQDRECVKEETFDPPVSLHQLDPEANKEYQMLLADTKRQFEERGMI